MTIMTLSIDNDSLPLPAQRQLAAPAADTSSVLAKLGLALPPGAAATRARLTRAQILQQAASAVRTQANGLPGAMLGLLR